MEAKEHRKYKPRIRLIKWTFIRSQPKCPGCDEPVLYGDPVYTGLLGGNPVHEWCAWKMKEIASKQASGNDNAK